MKIKLEPANFEANDIGFLLQIRRSVRDFQSKGITLNRVASILWAACGQKIDAVTGATRTIPSAGATYPLEFFVIIGEINVRHSRCILL